MVPYKIALICLFLPLVAVHLTLAIAIAFTNLEPCNPYWSECHSISATGRQYPEFFVFKALLIPTAVVMAIYWVLLRTWLMQLTNNQLKPRLMTAMGVTAGITLIVYTVALGAEGEPYALARRIGVVFYFAFTAFGHLLLLKHLDKVDTEKHGLAVYQSRLSISCIFLIGSAILSAIVGVIWETWWDKWENAYEWWFSLLMISMFYQTAQMWKKTQFTLTLSIQS